MVRCNLAILLAERNLKIKKVYEDTGISRTTLTALSYNHTQGIQYETLNALCIYLKVTPEQLIAFVPFDIKFSKIELEYKHIPLVDNSIEIMVSIKDKGRLFECGMSGFFRYSNVPSKDFIDGISIELLLWDSKLFKSSKIQADNELLIKYFKMLPITFLLDLESNIEAKIVETLAPLLIDGYAYSFSWPFEFIQVNR